MLKNKIIIKGKSAERAAVENLLMKLDELPEVIENSSVLLVLDNEVHMTASVDFVAVPSRNKAYTGDNVLTYSMTDKNADVTVFNLQPHEKVNSFELLYGFDMGRVFINKNSDIPVFSVLCVSAALIAGNVNVKKVIELFNSILK